MGGAGDPPVPVGDSPTGTSASNAAKRPSTSPRTVAPVLSGESPDGTGQWPVLPKTQFSNTLRGVFILVPFPRLVAEPLIRGPARRPSIPSCEWAASQRGNAQCLTTERQT